MSQKDVGNKVPIYKLKKTDEVMKYYDEWGEGNKYDKDMVDWNYTGPKETTEVYIKYEKNKNSKIYDAGCGTGLVGVELKKHGFSNFYGADLSQKLLDLVPKGLYHNLDKVDVAEVLESMEDKHIHSSIDYLPHPKIHCHNRQYQNIKDGHKSNICIFGRFNNVFNLFKTII